ncbi:MAG: flagellar motor switch protein FliN [Ahrensia sp.]|nr:flagellar motor switch protein FliN [Ahrensia sp.]
MSDPATNPLEELGLSLDDIPGADPLDEALAELQGVMDKDQELGPLDDLMEDAEPEAAAAPVVDSNLQKLVMSIPVQMDVVIGSAEMPVSDLIGMEAGSVVMLNRKIGEPVDICVNGTKIATGEIQSLDDDPSRLGVRITALEKS